MTRVRAATTIIPRVAHHTEEDEANISNAQAGGHQGSIGVPSLPDLLLGLKGSSSTGRLRLEREGVSRELYLKEGVLIGADSSAGTDSLEWLLFTAGVISEERHAEVRSLIQLGTRSGRALVESGSLSPATLCEWTERRARFLARDVLTWRSGTYLFEQDAAPPAGSIGLRVDPADLLLEALREGLGASALTQHHPSAEVVPELSEHAAQRAGRLLPHEMYVLSLIDGRRAASEICALSELGDAETLKTLALLRLAGCLRGPALEYACSAPVEKGAGQAGLPASLELPSGESPAELRAVIRIYNDLYAHLYGHLIKEVGPIAEQLLEKNLREVRDLHAALFARTATGRDGSLPEETLLRNVNMASTAMVTKDRSRRDLLVGALHDYLRGMVLAVRRILGPDHEEQVLSWVRETRCARI